MSRLIRKYDDTLQEASFLVFMTNSMCSTRNIENKFSFDFIRKHNKLFGIMRNRILFDDDRTEEQKNENIEIINRTIAELEEYSIEVRKFKRYLKSLPKNP